MLAVKGRVVPLLRVEAAHTAPGRDTPLRHQALDPLIRAPHGPVVGEADPAAVKQAVDMRREEQPVVTVEFLGIVYSGATA